ncbi:EpsD family peptidyl-prolyl cis-trans isomerase [Chitinivorax sp. PXF-14]|uniref:EpsD family peptidyl-prolyl cis-trans isomerase n=1 Tax=Chitinivorax sp. PXF-14 TaxID=3230488 RepID=UPI003467C7FD
MRRLQIALVLALPVLGGLVACGKKEGAADASQVVAKVGGSEVTVHQLNFALGGLQGVPQERIAEAKRQVLKGLVEQQLLANQAIESKLDRDPNVLMALETAKRQVLAKAYLERQVGQVPPVAEDKVKAYYNEHPELFAQRKIYRLNELSVADGAKWLDDVRKKSEAGEPIDGIKSYLEQAGAKVAAGAENKPAEQLPLAILPKLAALADKRSIVLPGAKGFTVIEVDGTRAEPVEFDKAKTLISTYLTNQVKMEKVKTAMDQAKSKVQVSYQGEFADVGNTATPVKVEAAPAPAAGSHEQAINQGVGALK